MGWILLVLVVLAVFFVISLFNRLVGARNGYKNAFAQIDVQLTRRYDLIPTWSKPSRVTSSTSAKRSKP